MKTKNPNTRFSFGLYREGLKKVRLIGIVAAVLCIVITALRPIVSIVDASRYPERYHGGTNWGAQHTSYVQTVGTDDFAPLLLILVFTPLIIFMMFSYLNKRSESDFFHSIPYHRETVYLSFTAAAMTWIWGIVIVSLTVSGILWGVHPYAVFAVTDLLQLGLAYFLSTAFIAGIALVAMMLTGTVATNLFLFMLIAGFVRVFGWLTTSCLEKLAPVYDISFSAGRFLDPSFSLPYKLLEKSFNSYNSQSFLSNPSLLVYTGVCALLLFIVAGVLYRFRKSEMAGNSAPNRILQHVYRCAFTLPFVLMLVAQLLSGSTDATWLIVNAVGVLLVYFLYELITTKKLKRLITAAPFLGVLALAGGIFAGSLLLATGGILKENIQADEIKTVSLYVQQNRSGGYFEAVTADIEIDDRDALTMVAEKLRETERAQLDGYIHPPYGGGDYGSDNRWETCNIRIRLKSGKVIGRKVWMRYAEKAQLEKYFISSPDYLKARTTLPDDSKIFSISCEFQKEYNANTEEIKELWKLFREEFAALDEEEKFELLNFSGTYIDGNYVGFRIYFNYNYVSYGLTIPVTSKTPRTLQRFFAIGYSGSDPNRTKDALRKTTDVNWWAAHPDEQYDIYIAMYSLGGGDPGRAIGEKSLLIQADSEPEIRAYVKSLSSFLDNRKASVQEKPYFLSVRITPYSDMVYGSSDTSDSNLFTRGCFWLTEAEADELGKILNLYE